MKIDSAKLVGSDMNLRLPSSEGSLPVPVPGMMSVHNNAIYKAKTDWSPIKRRVFSGAGPSDLIKGDNQAGFFGVVPAKDFISGAALASSLSLTAGDSTQSNADWLKFSCDDKILFVASKCMRNSIKWEDIYKAGAVYGDDTFGYTPSGGNVLQNARVTIEGSEYRVRLIRGAGSPSVYFEGSGTTSELEITDGSEWNRLMYRVHNRVPSRQIGENWANFSDSYLGVQEGTNSITLCQETITQLSSRRVGRGGWRGNIVYFVPYAATGHNTNFGWRPVLELIQ